MLLIIIKEPIMWCFRNAYYAYKNVKFCKWVVFLFGVFLACEFKCFNHCEVIINLV